MLAAIRELGLRNPVDVWRAARNFVRTIWDPTRSDIQHGINQLVYRGLREVPPEQVRALEAAQPELVALFAAGYDPELATARLESLPEGTLGREYARFLRANDIHPLQTLLSLGRPRTTLEYLFRRAYKLHDLMHVVLGADASVLGEVRIVAYSLGQAGPGTGRAPAMALAVLFMNIALRRPHEIAEAVELAHTWMQVGRRSRWHVTFRVEDWLERPVAELRARMLVDAPPAPCTAPTLRIA
jgi:ubiquinone biosynthesis protein Coq4